MGRVLEIPRQQLKGGRDYARVLVPKMLIVVGVVAVLMLCVVVLVAAAGMVVGVVHAAMLKVTVVVIITAPHVLAPLVRIQHVLAQLGH